METQAQPENFANKGIQPPSYPYRLSQGQLNVLSTCPRKFQHTYLEQLASPPTPDQQERLNGGSRFHLLLQQWQLGLTVEPLLKEDAQLQGWFNAFIQAAPQILALDTETDAILKQSEYAITLEFEGYLLTVVYDLLISSQNQAKILDWKTYPRPQNPRWLLQNWQTRLYPFVLAETSSYLPEQISMTYWFFQSEGSATEPQRFAIAYDTHKHEQNRKDLTQLLNQLTVWLERYQAGEAFPQISPEANQCEGCGFNVKCERSPLEKNRLMDREAIAKDQASVTLPNDQSFAKLPDLADIQEIPL